MYVENWVCRSVLEAKFDYARGCDCREKISEAIRPCCVAKEVLSVLFELGDEALNSTLNAREVLLAFTQDALAQMSLDSRVEKLVATELDVPFRNAPYRTNFVEEEAYVGVGVIPGGAYPAKFSMELPFAFRAERMPVGKFFGRWVKQCEDVFPAHILPGDEYPYAIESTLNFVRYEAFLEGVELTSVGFFVRGAVVVERATIVSAFDIASRGRTIRFEFNGPVVYPDGLVVGVGPIDMTLTPLGD